jgi:hypothetical protein
MTIEEARELAAGCWCDHRTSILIMDTNLAEVFAELLMRVTNKEEKEEKIQVVKDSNFSNIVIDP